MAMSWSNQLEAITAAAGTEMQILRSPSIAGNATERKAWYKASMLWSASARTKNPEAAVAFINWLVNSPESADINLAERGMPANSEIQAAITPKLSQGAADGGEVHHRHQARAGRHPDRPAARWRHSSDDTMQRYQTDVLFGQASSAGRRRRRSSSDEAQVEPAE